MTLTPREAWTSLHGIILGGAFLLAFTGSAVSLHSLRAEWTTPAGTAATTRRLLLGVWTMALLAWLTVLAGTFVIYPWYRAAPPPGQTTLNEYPKYLLISHPDTAPWHTWGMEWKEHVAWLAPILTTAVAIVATTHRKNLATEDYLRRTMLMMLCASFFCAAVAGLLGALINKVAPLR
jgi:hypothetical protein